MGHAPAFRPRGRSRADANSKRSLVRLDNAVNGDSRYFLSQQSLFILIDLLGEVVLIADFFDHMQLGFDPVHMFLFVDEYVFK